MRARGTLISGIPVDIDYGISNGNAHYTRAIIRGTRTTGRVIFMRDVAPSQFHDTYLHFDSQFQQQPDQLDVFVLDRGYERRSVQGIDAIDVQYFRVFLVLLDQPTKTMGKISAWNYSFSRVVGSDDRELENVICAVCSRENAISR